MIELYQFPKMCGLPNTSPFCMKLESYLIAQKYDYKNHYSVDMRGSPTGKMPYIKKDGKIYVDSSLIIDMLEEISPYPMQKNLSILEKSQTLAYKRLCEEHLYWMLVYNRWIDKTSENTWQKILSSTTQMPKFLFNIIFKVMTKNATKQLYEQGLGRLNAQQIYEKADHDLEALANFLADKNYFFVEHATLLDHIVYAFVANIFYTPWQSELKVKLNKYPNLIAHSKRMLAQFFNIR
ncbi:glutathione S-transferase family protein [Fastidiosibacter lacustris]|uniref:glutathione S-transferase family protein n=1 Tax=Fastidiosibacter lacustris TaxID=2056695 RepID=UPI0018650D1A|nr:glutathione S-transferase family protein [Fastidiosibacter lacustris]